MSETEREGTGGAEAAGDFPKALPNPARRALIAAGYTRMEQVAGVSDAELLKLHGMGPNGLRILRQRTGGAEPESDFPRAMGTVAPRELMAAGYVRMAQLAEVSDKELLKIHGVGPKALRVLRQALAEREGSGGRTPRADGAG